MKSFGLFVKNQSRVFDSLVLKVTNCLRWLGNVRCVCFNPVEFGLKSPVITTRADIFLIGYPGYVEHDPLVLSSQVHGWMLCGISREQRYT